MKPASENSTERYPQHPETVDLEKQDLKRDLVKGLLWALLILCSILYFTGTAAHFVYVDF